MSGNPQDVREWIRRSSVQASPLSLLSINTSSWKEGIVSVIASSPNSTLYITMKAVFAICAAMVAGAQVRWSERISILQCVMCVRVGLMS